jgi:hypothetical protein
MVAAARREEAVVGVIVAEYINARITGHCGPIRSEPGRSDDGGRLRPGILRKT